MPHTWGPKAGRQFTAAHQSAGPIAFQQPAITPSQKLRVLFVCIGNSCRSQMAEGFALHYGKDVMHAASAGLSPATLVAPLTRKAMLEDKGIDLREHWPKSVFETPGPFDLIVNISGHPLPPAITATEHRTWKVDDPVTGDQAVHQRVATQIESLVQQLILELRQRVQ